MAGLAALGLVAAAACSPQNVQAQNSPVQSVAADSGAQFGLTQVKLTIQSANGDHVFATQIAATPEQQQRGLMFRSSLGAGEAMIFPYSPPQNVAFWMHNTLIPLDMLFIRQDGTIARIVTATALDDTPVPSGEPVGAVLEIRGGRAGELGIREGDRASWPR
ncbi:MAG: DUF192 domain-containing protein [Sphingomicrobium sp.]